MQQAARKYFIAHTLWATGTIILNIISLTILNQQLLVVNALLSQVDDTGSCIQLYIVYIKSSMLANIIQIEHIKNKI